MRYILLYVFHLFLLAAESPFPIGISFRIIGYTASIMGVVCGIWILIDYSNEKRAAERFKIGRAFEIEEEDETPEPTPAQRGQMIWDRHARKWVMKIGEDGHGMAQVEGEGTEDFIFIKE